MNLQSVADNPVVRIIGIVASSILVLTKLFDIFNNSDVVTQDLITIVLAGLNLVALVVYTLMSTKVPSLKFIDNSKESKLKYCELFRVTQGNTEEEEVFLANYNNERVNKLVKQLNKNVLMYAGFLIFVYVIYLFPAAEEDHRKYLNYVADIFNFLSSVFVYLAFKVLHDQTLDDENQRKHYYNDAIIFSLIYLIGYIAFEVTVNEHIQLTPGCDPIENPQYKYGANLFGLISGLANGIAMSLLFGKYRELEHSIGAIDKIRPMGIVFFGTIFILPIYAIVQPLFGSFEIDAFGNPKDFANLVFFICFIGKVFFLYFTYSFIKEKLFHLHLHMLLTSRGIPPSSNQCFDIFEEK